MPLHSSIPLFMLSLTLVLTGSVYLSRWLNRLGRRLNIPEQFLGFVTALGADSPEITSAVVAMIAGHADTGVGVVFGSNLFNLSLLFGISAVIAGRISVRRSAVLLNGVVAIVITAAAVALALGAIGALAALIVVVALIVPNAALLSLRRQSLERLPLPPSWRRFVAAGAGESRRHGEDLQQTNAEDDPHGETGRQRQKVPAQPGAHGTGSLALWVCGALVVIILASMGLLWSTTALTAGWLPHRLLGVLVLAVLTGIPNLYTAVRLALRRRGAAVVTEALNSNNLNILVGLVIPSLFVGRMAARTTAGHLESVWLLAATGATVLMLAIAEGLSRIQGALIILSYAAFVSVLVYIL